MSLDQDIANELSSIKIPPRPAILTAIQREMQSDEPNLFEIEKVLSLDVGISACLVKLANSPLFGMGGRVRSIRRALHVLGLDAVAAAVAAIAFRQCFGKVPNLERFWDSSARIAQLSGWLAGQLRGTLTLKQEEVYTFGLFRDCGIPILLSMYSDYLDILKQANAERDLPFTLVERNELDVDHAMIGGLLVKEWELPDEFRSAIAAHHEIDEIRDGAGAATPVAAKQLIAIAQTAEYVFQRLTGLNQTCEWDKLGSTCLAILGIDNDELDALINLAGVVGPHSRPII